MDFQQAEQTFKQLEKMLAGGQISLEEYRAQLSRLIVVDAHGERWQIQERSGRWFTRRKGQWVEGRPAQERPLASQPAALAPREKRGKTRTWLLVVGGLLAACLVCVALAGGGWLAYQYIQPQAGVPGELPQLPGIPALPGASKEVHVTPGESITAAADGAPHADGHGVSLTVPTSALAQGGQAQLSASAIEGGWAAALEKHYTIDTPFYGASVLGKEDGAGRLTLTFPAPSPDSRVLAVVDGDQLALLSAAPQNGQITLHVRAGPAEMETQAGEMGQVRETQYAVITPRNPGGQSGAPQPVSYRTQADVMKRSCTPVLDAAYQLVSYCRQSEDGAILVNVPGDQLDKLASVDKMIDRVDAAMKAYAKLNFSAAKISKESLMIIRVFKGEGSPEYKPANGVLYIPIDVVEKIGSGSPTEVYHEMAHWIQDENYYAVAAYYSDPKTWWLETAAENMVMLLEEDYLAKNLTTYGTISHKSHQIVFQGSPYQWPADFYVQAQLVKLNMCDSAACPFSQAGFVEAINQGTYPLMDSSKQALVSANLDDYARYLLGKSPQKANANMQLYAPVVSGEGYGEYVTLTSTQEKDFAFESNGNKPQMREEKGIREQFVIEAGLEKDGVYPLVVKGAEAKYAAIPARLVIQPGAPFWYTLDDGEPVFSDGSKEVILQPIHIQLGYGKVRVVALGRAGGEVLRAKIEPIDLSGAWVVFPEKMLENNLTCSGDIDSDDSDPEQGDAYLAALLTEMIGATGDMKPDASGRSLDWSAIPARLPKDVDSSEFTFQATALQSPKAILYQSRLDMPRPESRRFEPGAGIGLALIFSPALFLRRFRRRGVLLLAVMALLVATLSGCGAGFAVYGTVGADITLDGMKYIGGQDSAVVTLTSPPSGQPLWQMTGKATYQVELSTVAVAVVMDQKKEKNVTCKGTVTYQVTTSVYRDAAVVLDSGEE